MRLIDIKTWKREAIFNHFINLKDPYFGVVIPFDVTIAYSYSKDNNISFFGKYLHDCMKAINEVDNLRYRIIDGAVVDFETIHASATLMKADKTFGFSFINFEPELPSFINNINKEKERVENSAILYPPVNSENCIHCSVLPWFNFISHKEPVSGLKDSVPKVAFSKVLNENGKLIMNVSINVNHALVDGYHIGLFSEKFQYFLNK